MKFIILLLTATIINAYNFKNTRMKPNNIKNIDYDYEIPDWVYKKVFKYNKPYKFKEEDYFYGFRERISVKKIDTNYKK